MKLAWWRHGIPAAVGVLLGAVVGVLVNVVTSDAQPAAIVALVVVALCWASTEAWQTARARPVEAAATTADRAPNLPAVRVRISAEQVDRGTVRGIVAPEVPAAADVQVTVRKAKDATITGIDTPVDTDE